MEYNSFEDMPVWQKAMDLAVRIHNLTERLTEKRRLWLNFAKSEVRDYLFPGIYQKDLGESIRTIN